MVVPPPPAGTKAKDTCPPVVATAVAKAYPTAKRRACRAETEDGHAQFEVELVVAGATLALDVSLAGVITQTEQLVAAAALPPAVAAALAARYPGATATRVEKISVPGKPDAFEILLSTGKEPTFAVDGTFVEEE